jgi:hypothetical protein
MISMQRHSDCISGICCIVYHMLSAGDHVYLRVFYMFDRFFYQAVLFTFQRSILALKWVFVSLCIMIFGTSWLLSYTLLYRELWFLLVNYIDGCVFICNCIKVYIYIHIILFLKRRFSSHMTAGGLTFQHSDLNGCQVYLIIQGYTQESQTATHFPCVLLWRE